MTPVMPAVTALVVLRRNRHDGHITLGSHGGRFRLRQQQSEGEDRQPEPKAFFHGNGATLLPPVGLVNGILDIRNRLYLKVQEPGWAAHQPYEVSPACDWRTWKRHECDVPAKGNAAF